LDIPWKHPSHVLISSHLLASLTACSENPRRRPEVVIIRGLTHMDFKIISNRLTRERVSYRTWKFSWSSRCWMTLMPSWTTPSFPRLLFSRQRRRAGSSKRALRLATMSALGSSWPPSTITSSVSSSMPYSIRTWCWKMLKKFPAWLVDINNYFIDIFSFFLTLL